MRFAPVLASAAITATVAVPASVTVTSVSPRFAAPVSYLAGGDFAFWISAGDLNGDRRADAVVGMTSEGEDYRTTVLFARADGTLARPRKLRLHGNGGVAIRDFDDDGKRDVLRLSSTGGAVALGDGRGGFTARTRFDLRQSPDDFLEYPLGENPAVTDLNRDGNLDLALVVQSHAARAEGLLYVLLGDGRGGLAGVSRYNVGMDPQSVAVGDFDRDGAPDVAIANQGPFQGPRSGDVRILLGDGTGHLNRTGRHSVGRAPSHVVAADLNRDRRLDLIVRSGVGRLENVDEVVVLRGLRHGRFSLSARSRIGATYLSVGDFNLDRRPDLAAVSGKWLPRRSLFSVDLRVLGTPRGLLDLAGKFRVCRANYCDHGGVAVGDLNRDRKPDLILAGGTSGRVFRLLNASARRAGRRTRTP